jgi:hypothetical protein
LVCSRFQVLAAHDADADTGADGTQADDEASGQSNKADNFHGETPKGTVVEKG